MTARQGNEYILRRPDGSETVLATLEAQEVERAQAALRAGALDRAFIETGVFRRKWLQKSRYIYLFHLVLVTAAVVATFVLMDWLAKGLVP